MITRLLHKTLAASKKSILLLGPRQTGKSTLAAALAPDLTLNLAHEETFLEFLRNPGELEQRLAPLPARATVLIDEVQRVPSVLNTVQVLLDSKPSTRRFVLTGSSARKLRRGNANLLPGRVHTYLLGPLCCGELGYQMPTRKALAHGTLPGVWTEDETEVREKTLRSYASTYLREEIRAEGLVRNLEGFTRFLDVAASWSGQFLDLSKLATAAQVPRQSVVRFFEVLEDSLLVLRLNSFAKSLTRRLVQHPRFLFFDVGVLNGLLGNFTVSPDREGRLFEQLVVTQILHEAAARDVDVRLSTYRTENGAEVDVIVERKSDVFAIEIKSGTRVDATNTRGLKSFADYYGKKHQPWIFYGGDVRRRVSEADVWPWQRGIEAIFG